MSNLSSTAWLISLRKRAKNAYFAQLDELSKLSLVERSCISYRRVGGRLGARSINIYVGYMLANFGTGSMKYKPECNSTHSFTITSAMFRGNNLRHSMDVTNTQYGVIFYLQGKFFAS